MKSHKHEWRAIFSEQTPTRKCFECGVTEYLAGNGCWEDEKVLQERERKWKGEDLNDAELKARAERCRKRMRR